MITAVDTSVLLTFIKKEKNSRAWLELLKEESTKGKLIACEVVVAECAAFIDNDQETIAFFDDLGIDYVPLLPKAALMTGQLFKKYRQAGGPRQHLVPDFLIGAHALLQAQQLAAADRGYLRRYFPKLKVICPSL